MVTVAAYLADLRTSRKISRARLAEMVGTTEMSILRIEKQGQEPSGALLVRLVAALGASWEVITKLVDSPDDEASRVAAIAALTPEAATPEEDARLSRLIDLLAEGVPPDEAARRVQREQ